MFFWEDMAKLWRCIVDLYDPAVFFCLPDQVPKFRFFVIEGKEPGERDVPTPCLWQHHVVMIFISSVFIIYRHPKIKQVLGMEKPMVQYWINSNLAHHARWKAIWTSSWPWTIAQALWIRFHGFKNCRQGTYQTLIYLFFNWHWLLHNLYHMKKRQWQHIYICIYIYPCLQNIDLWCAWYVTYIQQK